MHDIHPIESSLNPLNEKVSAINRKSTKSDQN
jgi:hypothetical protein